MKSYKKSIGKNYLYNLIYQIFKIIVPLIVTPYVARVLTENGTGKYSFSYSIVTYFSIFAALGFANYAQRLIASHQGNTEQQSIDFWEIIIARLIPTFVSLGLYLIIVYFGVFDSRYTIILLILSIEIISNIFDVSFFFQGNEEFGTLVLMTIIFRTIGFIFIFLFIKDKNDVGLYALFLSSSLLLSNISLWVFLKGKLRRVQLKSLKPLKHFPSTLLLFLPTIAISVYTTLDKTLIGLITKSDNENGNYEYAEKLIKMAVTVITSIGTVFIPRNSKYFADNDIKSLKKNIYDSCNYVFLLGLPMMLGFLIMSDNIVPWYLGNGYNKAGTIMKVLSPLIIIIGLSNVFGMQYLIPCKRDKKFTISIIIGAITNLILNIIMIYLWGSVGAAISTIIAESCVTISMYLFVRKEIKIRTIVFSSWKYLISSICMGILCYFLCSIFAATLLYSLIIIFSCIICYFSLLILLKDNMIMKLITLIKGKLINKTH